MREEFSFPWKGMIDWLDEGGVAEVKESGDMKCSSCLLFDCFYSICGILTIQRHKGVWKQKKRDETKHVTACSKGGLRFNKIKSHDY